MTEYKELCGWQFVIFKICNTEAIVHVIQNEYFAYTVRVTKTRMYISGFEVSTAALGDNTLVVISQVQQELVADE